MISRDQGYLINLLNSRAAKTEQALILAGGEPTVSSGGMAAATLFTIYSERLVPNGSQTVFTLANNYRTGSIRLFVNGLRYTPGGAYDYTETSSTGITFLVAPKAWNNLLVDYDKF